MAEHGIVALAGVTLAASLFGSAHCAGMCGGIAAVAAGEGPGMRLARSAGYHAGRLASYAAVGALAGLAGSILDDTGALVGLQRVASVAAGLCIAAFGALAILRALGVRIGAMPVPASLVRLAASVHAQVLRLPPSWRGVPLGLATPLLPCGWLYAFAAIAAGGGSPAVGIVVMVAFWAGTVPALAAVAGGARLVLARLGRAAPVAMGVAMCAVGLQVVFSRASLAEDVLLHAARRTSAVRAAQIVEDGPLHAREAGGAGLTGAGDRRSGAGDLGSAVSAAAAEVPPCCRSRP